MSASGIKLIHVTTVPQTLGFFPKHIDYLKKRGFDIHLVSSPGKYGSDFAASTGLALYPIPMSRAITPGQDLFALYAMWRLFVRLRPVIVHSHTPKAGLLGTIAARLACVPVVFLSQFGLPQMTFAGGKRRLLDGLTKVSCALADRVWIDSPSMRDHFIRSQLCRSDKITILGKGSVSGVDAVREFSPDKRTFGEGDAIRSRLGIPHDALVLGYVGRIVRDKGMHELAIAWTILKREYPSLHLLVVGQPEERDSILPEDRIIYESDPRIHTVGFTTNVPAYMAAMDIYVMPSYREGLPHTNIEAAAMELPVVSTLVPGCVDSVKNGETGTLVPARDEAALAQAIRYYLDDRDLRLRHGRAGRLYVIRDFEQSSIWQDLGIEYEKLMDAKAPHIRRFV